MTVPRKLPDFNVRQMPVAAKLVRIFDATLWLLVGTPLSLAAVGLVAGAIIVIAVSRPVRVGHGFWIELLVVAIYFAVRELIAIPFYRLLKSQWYQDVAAGRPRFGPLKGPGKYTFQFILRCFASVDMLLEPDSEAIFRKAGDYQITLVEASYRQKYDRGGFDPSDWPNVWQRIRQAKFAGVEYGDAIRTNRWSMFWLKFYLVGKLVIPLAALYVVGISWLLTDVAQGRNPLRLIQFALVAGLVIAFVIFINYTTSLRTMAMLDADQEAAILGDLRDRMDAQTRADLDELKKTVSDPELEGEIRSQSGRVYYPVVEFKRGYVEGIRNEFVRLFLIIGVVNFIALSIFLLLQWPVARVLSRWSVSQVDTWTIKMLIGTALTPLALSVALVLGFVILSRFKKFAGVLATGLLLAVVPPVITYALRGHVGNVVLYSSLVSAAIGVIPSAVAELIREKSTLGATPESAV